MKLNAALARSVLMAASIGLVVPVRAQPSPRPAAPKQGLAGEEEEGVVAGIAIARPGGRWLGVTMEGLNLRLTFYNAKKQPEPVDVRRGGVRWKPPTIPEFERAVLNPAPDGVSLLANRPIRKPWVFTVSVVLVGDNDEVVESYQVRLSDAAAAPPPGS